MTPLQSPPDLEVLAGSLNQLQLTPTTAYTALDGTLHALTKLTSLASELHLEAHLSLTDLFHIAHLAEKARQREPYKMTYLKKDALTLKTSLIIDQTATYVVSVK